MFEKEIFTIGVWLGYFITVFVFLFVFSCINEAKLNKMARFLRETKQLQKFGDWSKANEFKLKFVKDK